jgi:hypothetical protein
VDVTTGALTNVNTIGNNLVLTDIAMSPTNSLFGISFTQLYSLDSTTYAATSVGGFGGGISEMNSLTFGSDGTLYGAGYSTGNLYRINPTTGVATVVGATGYNPAGDLAFAGSNLYLVADTKLVLVNTTTGAGTLVGDLGFTNIYGLASPDGTNLYAVGDNKVYSINKATGAATYLSTWNGNANGFQLANGATSTSFATPPPNPPPPPAVPEPATYGLMGSGLALGVLAHKLTRRKA